MGVGESPASHQTQRIWAAYLTIMQRGRGLRSRPCVALARSETAMRQMLSRMLSRDESAIVAPGLDQLDELVHRGFALVPDRARQRLLNLESGEDDAAVFTFFGANPGKLWVSGSLLLGLRCWPGATIRIGRKRHF